MSSEPHIAPDALPRATSPVHRSDWNAGRIASLVAGTLLVLVSLVLLGGGGTGLWADLTQRHGGFVTAGAHSFSTSGSALVTEPTHLGSAGVGWLYAPGLLGEIRVRVTPTDTARPLFVGIGRSADVDRYLAGVSHTLISDFFGDKEEAIGGTGVRSAPGTQRFWVATSTGAGARTLMWHPKHGSWSVIVMNADAQPGLGVRADLGARFPAVRWIAIGFLLAGAVFLTGGGLLVLGAIRRHERSTNA